MEKSDVYILDNRHWIFGNHVDTRVYLSIPKFSGILELLGHKQTIASTRVYHTSLTISFPYHNHCFLRRQMDIGLEIYETKDFFVRLLIPTFFVIITVVQMHYFHNDFLKITTIDKLGYVIHVDSLKNFSSRKRWTFVRIILTTERFLRSESALRRSSLGHIPSLNPSTMSPTEIILGEEETSNVYTLNQLKRTLICINLLR